MTFSDIFFFVTDMFSGSNAVARMGSLAIFLVYAFKDGLIFNSEDKLNLVVKFKKPQTNATWKIKQSLKTYENSWQ